MHHFSRLRCDLRKQDPDAGSLSSPHTDQNKTQNRLTGCFVCPAMDWEPVQIVAVLDSDRKTHV